MGVCFSQLTTDVRVELTAPEGKALGDLSNAETVALRSGLRRKTISEQLLRDIIVLKQAMPVRSERATKFFQSVSLFFAKVVGPTLQKHKLYTPSFSAVFDSFFHQEKSRVPNALTLDQLVRNFESYAVLEVSGVEDPTAAHAAYKAYLADPGKFSRMPICGAVLDLSKSQPEPATSLYKMVKDCEIITKLSSKCGEAEVKPLHAMIEFLSTGEIVTAAMQKHFAQCAPMINDIGVSADIGFAKYIATASFSEEPVLKHLVDIGEGEDTLKQFVAVAAAEIADDVPPNIRQLTLLKQFAAADPCVSYATTTLTEPGVEGPKEFVLLALEIMVLMRIAGLRAAKAALISPTILAKVLASELTSHAASDIAKMGATQFYNDAASTSITQYRDALKSLDTCLTSPMVANFEKNAKGFILSIPNAQLWLANANVFLKSLSGTVVDITVKDLALAGDYLGTLCPGWSTYIRNESYDEEQTKAFLAREGAAKLKPSLRVFWACIRCVQEVANTVEFGRIDAEEASTKAKTAAFLQQLQYGKQTLAVQSLANCVLNKLGAPACADAVTGAEATNLPMPKSLLDACKAASATP